MTLTRLLGIKKELLRYEDQNGLHLAERMWSESGEPIEPQALSDTLDAILDRCKESVISYPAVILKRKKQLERGTWKPEFPSHRIQNEPATGEIVSGCRECGGRGYLVSRGGRQGSLCMKCLGRRECPGSQ